MLSEVEILPVVFSRKVDRKPVKIDSNAYERSYNGIENEIRRERRKLKKTFDPVLVAERMKRIDKLKLIKKDIQCALEKN